MLRLLCFVAIEENCWGNSITIHVESKITYIYMYIYDMERIKDCKAELFWVCMACRPDVGQHSHVTRSQHVGLHVGLHVGPAKVVLKTMLQVCKPHVGWMSASVGHEISSAEFLCSLQTETPP